MPEHLQPFWERDFWTFHSASWWSRLWGRTGAVDVEIAELLEDGWRDWLSWNEVCAEVNDRDFVLDGAGREARLVRLVRLDAGRNLGLARIMGVKPVS